MGAIDREESKGHRGLGHYLLLIICRVFQKQYSNSFLALPGLPLTWLLLSPGRHTHHSSVALGSRVPSGGSWCIPGPPPLRPIVPRQQLPALFHP